MTRAQELVERSRTAIARLRAELRSDEERKHLLSKLTDEEHAGALVDQFGAERALLFLQTVGEHQLREWLRRWPHLLDLVREAIASEIAGASTGGS